MLRYEIHHHTSSVSSDPEVTDIIEVSSLRRRSVSNDQPDYLKFLANGGVPDHIYHEAPIVPIPPTLEDVKARKVSELTNAKWQAVNAGLEWNGMNFETNDSSRALINGAVTASLLDESFTVSWKLGDGSYYQLNKAALAMVASVIMAHVEAQFTKEQGLLQAVAGCATAEEVNAITWEEDHE